MTLTLLTRAYCHLCDEMLAAVRPLAAASGAILAVIDVDANPWLERLYGDRVPVLFAGDPDGRPRVVPWAARSEAGRSRIAGSQPPSGPEVAPEAKIR